MRLSHKALLTHVTISRWGGEKLTKGVAREVEREKGAGVGAFKVSKLMVNTPLLAAIQKQEQQIRMYVNTATLPWDDYNRILNSGNFFKFREKVVLLREEFEMQVGKLCTEYPLLVQQAESWLGTEFDLSEYPTVEQLKKKFAVGVEFKQVPEAEDFRVALDAEDVKQIKEGLERETEEKMKAAQLALGERVLAPLAALVSKLENFKEGGRIHATLLTNVMDAIETAPELDLVGDPRLEAACKEIKQAFSLTSIENLRDEEGARKIASDRAKELLEDYAGLGA